MPRIQQVIRVLAFILVFLYVNDTGAQTPSLKWAKRVGGSGSDYCNSFSIDNAGDIVTTGDFWQTVDFDPGAGVFPMSSNGEYDIFILKLDTDGNFKWAKSIGGPGADVGSALRTDASGNIYVSGLFFGTVDFDPGPGSFPLTTADPSRAESFILKLDANGQFVWAVRFENVNIRAIATDAAGNLFATGGFYSIADFDPSAGNYPLTETGFTGLLTGYQDVFVLKLDAAGGFVWVKQMGGDRADLARAISLDAAGNILITGDFYTQVDFDPGPGTMVLITNGIMDTFIAKLDLNGNLVWVDQFGAQLEDYGRAITTDNSGNVYASGNFYANTDFDPGPGVFNLTPAYYADIFIIKLNAAGALQWVKNQGGPSGLPKLSNAIALDNSGNVYTTGYYNATVDFDPGPAVLNLTSNGLQDIFISKLDNNGNIKWAYSMGDVSNFDSGQDIKVDAAGNIYTTGFFWGTVDFAPGNTVFNLTMDNNGDGYIQKLGQCLTVTYTNIDVTICEGENYAGHTSSGIFTDTYSSVTGCDSVRTLNLTVNPRKYTPFNVSICQGQSYTAGGAPQTTSGVYTDTLQNFQGCDSIIVTTLLVNPNPQPNLGADRNICIGSTISLNPGNFANYEWQDMSTGPVFPVSSPGQYWVKVDNGNSCSSADTVNILALISPPANFLKNTDSVCSYESLAVQSLIPFSNYQWSTGSTQPAIDVNQPGQYWLEATDADGCTGRDTINIITKNCLTGMHFPRAFTPNHDGKNDDFKALVYGNLVSYKMEIYDRNGELIFRSTDPQKGWDGNYHGQTITTSVFVWQCWYQLEGEAAERKQGVVVIIR